MRQEAHLMPIERVLLPLVDVEFLDVIAVPDCAEPSDVRCGDRVGMHRRDEEAVIGDIAGRNVAGAEVVRDANSELVRRDDDSAGRSLLARRRFCP